jgi:hypothetical protein
MHPCISHLLLVVKLLAARLATAIAAIPHVVYLERRQWVVKQLDLRSRYMQQAVRSSQTQPMTSLKTATNRNHSMNRPLCALNRNAAQQTGGVCCILREAALQALLAASLL